MGFLLFSKIVFNVMTVALHRKSNRNLQLKGLQAKALPIFQSSFCGKLAGVPVTSVKLSCKFTRRFASIYMANVLRGIKTNVCGSVSHRSLN